MRHLTVLAVIAALAITSPLKAATDDDASIRALLDAYTGAVTRKDPAAFKALLLDERIPFSYVDAGKGLNKDEDLRGYPDFRQAVFGGTERFSQTFDHVRIERDGALAAVTLHFQTRSVPGPGVFEGFKTLQLVKVGGSWKIASELFTGQTRKL